MSRAFSYLWSFLVMWQWWRSHHSICCIRKPHAARKHYGLMSCRMRVIADRSFTMWEQEFWMFLAFLTLTRWLLYTNVTRIQSGDILNFLWQGFRKLSTDSHTYIHIDRRTGLKLYISCCFVGGQLCHCCSVYLLWPGSVVWGEHESRALWSSWCNTTRRCYSSWWWTNHPDSQALLLCLCVDCKTTSHGAHLSCRNPGSTIFFHSSGAKKLPFWNYLTTY